MKKVWVVMAADGGWDRSKVFVAEYYFKTKGDALEVAKSILARWQIPVMVWTQEVQITDQSFTEHFSE